MWSFSDIGLRGKLSKYGEILERVLPLMAEAFFDVFFACNNASNKYVAYNWMLRSRKLLLLILQDRKKT